MKVKPAVSGRSREFQDYLDRLDYHERVKIEAGEATYLKALPARLFYAETVYAEQMLGVEDRPAGPTRKALFDNGQWGA